MVLRCVADFLAQAEPCPLERRPLRRVEFVARPVSINGRVAEFELTHAIEPAPDLPRQRGQLLGRDCRRRLALLGPGYLWPRQLVLGALFVPLEGGGAEEEHLALLDRRHPTARERAAVAGPVALLHDRPPTVPRAPPPRMQRTH